MAVRPRYIKLEETPKTNSGDRSPVVKLLYLSGQGIVFQSRHYFETGTKLAIGLHFDKIRQDLGLSNAGHLFDLSPYLDVQGFVADCKLMGESPGGASYQVTLLFDGLDGADEIFVESILRELEMHKQPPPVLTPPRHETGLN